MRTYYTFNAYYRSTLFNFVAIIYRLFLSLYCALGTCLLARLFVYLMSPDKKKKKEKSDLGSFYVQPGYGSLVSPSVGHGNVKSGRVRFSPTAYTYTPSLRVAKFYRSIFHRSIAKEAQCHHRDIERFPRLLLHRLRQNYGCKGFTSVGLLGMTTHSFSSPVIRSFRYPFAFQSLLKPIDHPCEF